ncbi:MAG TPA: protein phosphatase 2C domain-containing protein [Vicinamibacteria bacterium]|nr:protein phosphatase 2C domain-containing protein [Vicinamibacteria bacterium]
MKDKSELDTAEFPIPRLELEEPKPLSSRVEVDLAALTDTGKVREQNEDHFYVARVGRRIDTILTNIPSGDVPAHFDETGYVIIVADGMGGAQGGEVASRLAIATLVNIIISVPDWILRLDEEHAQEVMERAAGYYRRVNLALLERARVEPRLRGMGTTMTATYSLGDDLFVANVGDSRAYIFRDGRLQLLTRDQTQAQLLADVGAIGQSEVARHRLRHVLTNALGGSEKELRVDVQRLKLADGDRLLVCTDGLTDMISDEEIAELLRDQSSEKACHELVNRALAKGGKDNVTVVVARYSIPDLEDD